MASLDFIFVYLRLAFRSRLFWLGGPILLYAWTLTGPFLADDLLLILKSEQYARGESAAPRLYRFATDDEAWNELRHRGTSPWWLSETGRLDFFRPVSEWVFYGAYLCFGRNPLGHRALSLFVFAGLLLATRWMFRQTGATPLRAAAATFFFGISQTVTPPVTWVCNRQDLLAALGVVLAAGMYWRSKSNPTFTVLIVAPLAYALALLSKEIALPLIGVILVYEGYLHWRVSSRKKHPHVILIVSSLAVIAAVYLAYYFASRPWAVQFSGQDGCTSLLTSIGPLSLLLYSAVWTIGFPIDVLFGVPEGYMLLVAAVSAVLTHLAIVTIRKSARDDRAALFFAFWAVMFMLPGLRTLTASSRTLCLATIGWSYLLTSMILPDREQDVVVPRIVRHWFYTVNGIVSICCAIATVLFMNGVERTAQEKLQQIVAACRPPLADGDTLIVQSPDSAIESICSGDRLEYVTGLRHVSLAYLVPPGVSANARVEDTHTLLLQSKAGNLFGSPLHRLTQPRGWSPKVGEIYRLRDFSIEIAETGPGGIVRAMRLRFNCTLADPRLHFHPPELDRIASQTTVERYSQAEDSTP